MQGASMLCKPTLTKGCAWRTERGIGLPMAGNTRPRVQASNLLVKSVRIPV
jgi:hypothetical protein